MLTPNEPLPLPRPLRNQAGFTVLEIAFAVAIFAAFAVLSVISFSQLNWFASSARYETLALAAAQQKMDQIMTTPWSVSGATPAVLTAGTTTETNLPLNNDSFNTETGLSSAFTNYDTQVLDSRKTVITAVGGNTRLLSVAVTVSYTYRGRSYSITQYGLRATDDF